MASKTAKIQWLIPGQVLDLISKYTRSYCSVDKQQQRMESEMVELWLFIQLRHHDAVSFSKHPTNQANEWVSIPFKYLESFRVTVNKKQLQYTDLLNALITMKLVERNDVYSAGRFTKSYRIPSAIQNMPREYEVDITEYQKRFTKSIEDYLNTYPELRGQIEASQNYYVDMIKLRDYCHVHSGTIIKQKMLKSRLFEFKNVYLDITKQYEIITAAQKINSGIVFWNIADTGRIYSSFSNLNKVALQFLRHTKFKTLVEIDVANCQPLILASLLQHNQLKKSCEIGAFYDDIATHHSFDRNVVKSMYMKIAYDDKHLSKWMIELIDEVYPGVAAKIDAFKRPKQWDKLQRKHIQVSERTELLWFLLQKQEADIFTAIIQSYPESITRHDSIITTRDNLNSIIQDLETSFWDATKSNVTIKVNELNKNN